jgi:hypothetical protein
MGVADGLGGRWLLDGVEDLDGLAHWSSGLGRRLCLRLGKGLDYSRHT